MLQKHILIQPRVMPRENLNHHVLGDVALTFYNIFAFAVRNNAEICFAKLGGQELDIDELMQYVYETNQTAHSIDVKMRVFLPTKGDDCLRRLNVDVSVDITPVLVGNLSQVSEKTAQALHNSPETEMVELFIQFLWMHLPVPASRYQYIEQYKSGFFFKYTAQRNPGSRPQVSVRNLYFRPPRHPRQAWTMRIPPTIRPEQHVYESH